MKYLLSFLLFVWTTIVTAQIKTPSFAKYNRCPISFSSVSYCVGWRQPTHGTCDYFNQCSPNNFVDVPNNHFGTQDNAIHAYTGLLTLSTFDYKEYIGTRIQPLTVGQTYTMTITVSLSDSSSIATDGLGTLFTTYPISLMTTNTIPLTPQVDYSSYGPITDKVNWVTLTKTFVADSAYTHLTVGCFKPSSSLVTTPVPGGITNAPPYCYYYIGEIGEPDSTYFGDSVYAPVTETFTVTPTDTTKPPREVTETAESDTAVFIFPNAFSPNNDGTNDLFRIRGLAGNDYKGYILRVYNRWGECVFMTRDANQGWDGTYHNEPQPLAVYFYYAEFGLNKKHHLIKGDVSLIR
jgi:gliding motility-associated-like protein